MEHFSPGSALVGGLLIGAGSLVLLSCNGRVMGIGGILEALLRGERGLWRPAFLIGMVLPMAVVALLAPGMVSGVAVADTVTGLSTVPAYAVLVGAGLLVGFGSRMASGCTSGHTVCGLARLSRRSVVATLVFAAVTAITVYVIRHVL